MFEQTSGGMYDSDRIQDEIEDLPDLLGGSSGDNLGIIVSYEMEIPLPFIDTVEITLMKKAQERIWA
jgi:hypothetical protein